jgi:hypothetical protein
MLKLLNFQIQIKCNYLKCERRRQITNDEFSVDKELAAELNYKLCHYCLTYYCSKECRKFDWLEHKQSICYYGNLSSLCKRILSKIGRCHRLRVQLSKISKTAFLSTAKRGFVWLDFSTKAEAQKFFNEPIVKINNDDGKLVQKNNSNELSDFLFYFGNNLLPKYVCFENSDRNVFSAKENTTNDLFARNDFILKTLFNLNHSMDNNVISLNDYNSFKRLCLDYDPKSECILLVSIQTDSNEVKNHNLIPNKYTYNRYVIKYMKFKYVEVNHYKSIKKQVIESTFADSSILTLPIDSEQDKQQSATSTELKVVDDFDLNSATLIVTSLNKFEHENEEELKKNNDEENRQLFMVNLMTEFETRGIDIKLKFPNLYRDLCAYVEQNKFFSPVCMFPRDVNKNNLFMCLIVPSSEPTNNSWIYEDAKNLEKSLNLSNYLYIA